MFNIKAIDINRTEVLLLVLAIAPVLLSLVASIYLSQSHWFGRSGSLMVLFSVMLDFRIARLASEKIASASVMSTFSGLPISPSLPPSKSKLHKFTLILIVLGTLIWGYGDLLI